MISSTAAIATDAIMYLAMFFHGMLKSMLLLAMTRMTYRCAICVATSIAARRVDASMALLAIEVKMRYESGIVIIAST